MVRRTAVSTTARATLRSLHGPATSGTYTFAQARIASSVYSDVCGAKDPLCRTFGFSEQGEPAPRMAMSMLYKVGIASGIFDAP